MTKIFLPFVIVLLVACSSFAAPTQTQVQTPQPTATVTPLSTALLISNPTVTNTAQPNATGRPTSTSAATPTVQANSSPVALTLALQPEVTGLSEPLFVTHAGDGSGEIYIVEKRGLIRIALNGVLRPQPFLDITNRVNSGDSERGLLGLAFDPQYKTNGFLFVNYTDLQGNTVVARYHVASDRHVAEANSEKIILRIQQPFANHNGGNLVFGPDGMLWIGMGDGGSGGDPFGNGQNKNVLLGKLLRIDADHGDPYVISSDNPFVNDPNARGEIWAYGLRNPWRWSFDRASGDLYIGDVGQSAWEEIDYVPAGTRGGLNFGWNRMEGMHCYPPNSKCDPTGLTLPVMEYQTDVVGCAIVGGYVYRGKQFPALNGIYFYSDNCTPTIWSLTRRADGTWISSIAVPRASTSIGVSSFGEDEAGELYVTGLTSGIVYRLVAK